MKQRRQRFSDEFRFKVAREYMVTDSSQEELQEKYNIKGSSCITNWVRKFGLTPEPIIRRRNGCQQIEKSMGQQKTREEKVLEQKVRELEEQLKYEKLRSTALDTMINIAEKEFKIPIRKKSGTEQ